MKAPVLLGMALLAGWAALVCAGAGIDLADGLGGTGAGGLAFGLALAASAAAWTAIVARDAEAFRSWPALLALGAGGGLVAWTAASISWAAAPDLAWLDANRVALTFAALVVGVGLGGLIPSASRFVAIGLSIAAAPAVLWGVATKLLPAGIAGEGAAGRLQEPVTYSNALGLVTAIAVPGALLVAMESPRRSWRAPVASAWITLLVVTCLLTLSRSGLVLLALAAIVTLAGDGRRARGAIVALAGAIGALLPGIYVLADDAITSATAGEAARTAAGAGLAWRLVIGVVIAAGITIALERADTRLGLTRRAAAGSLLVPLLAALALATAPAGASADPASVVPTPSPAALTNESDRLASGSLNNRARWWEEAYDGWRSAPVIGAGAGGFRLVQLQEREDNQDALRTVEPHQAILRTLSGTGLIGGLLLAGTIAGIGWGAVRAARRAPWGDVGAPIAIVAAVLLQGLVDWTIAIPALTVAGAAAAGTLLSRADPGQVEAGRRSGAGVVLVPGVVVLAILAVASGLLPWGSQQAVSASRDALAAGDTSAALERAELAATLNPLSPEPLWAEAEARRAAGEPGLALGAYVRATELQPDNPATWRRLGLVAGDTELGTAAWTEALRLDPQDEQAQARSDPSRER